jgi:hypothetical protein
MSVGYFTKQSAHQHVWRKMDQIGDFQTTCHHLRYKESIITESSSSKETVHPRRMLNGLNSGGA